MSERGARGSSVIMWYICHVLGCRAEWEKWRRGLWKDSTDLNPIKCSRCTEEKSVIASSRRSSQAIKRASRFRISLSNLEATCCNISVFTGLIETRNTCRRTLTWLDLKTAEVKSKPKEKHLRMWLSLHTLSMSLPFLWLREDPEGWKEGVV